MDEQAGPGVFFSNSHPAAAAGVKGLGPLAEAAAAGDGAAPAAAGAARAQYSLPGILHFLQHEWARFEVERAQWEVERAELQILPLVKERNGEDKRKLCGGEWETRKVASEERARASELEPAPPAAVRAARCFYFSPRVLKERRDHKSSALVFAGVVKI